MSKRNIIAGLALASTLLAAPAFADGKDGSRYTYKSGPVPLQSMDLNAKRNICPSGTIEYDAAGRLVCRTRSATSTARPYAGTTTNRGYTTGATTNRGYTTTAPRTRTATNRGYTTTAPRTRTATNRSYTTTAPRRVSAPAPTRIAAPAPAALTFDTNSFTGGVGAGIGGGSFGGGGGFISTSRAPFSGVLSHAASALTFNRRKRGGHGGGHGGGGHGGGGHGGGGGCGC